MKTATSHPLSIAHLQANPQVAYILPSELAQRYRALPIAKDGERLTVAMAHPEDELACQALMATLGPTICLVKADEQEMDRLISELWPQKSKAKLKIMGWFPVEHFQHADLAYAQSVCTLLDGELIPCDAPLAQRQFIKSIAETISENPVDMLIFRSPDPPLYKRLLLEPAEQSYIHRIPTSLLIVRKPRWPIRQILLVFHDAKSDDAALSWSIRLAKNNQATVTILPLLPSPPEMFAHMRARHSFAEILGRDDPLGAQLRCSAQQLAERKIESKLRLRNEPLEEQVRCEVADGDYDLIIMSARTGNKIGQWVLGQLVNPLLQWADRPLLITKK